MAQAIHDGGFRGIGVWRLGAEDPGLWTVLAPGTWPSEDIDPSPLDLLTATKQVNPYSGGEFLHVAEEPHDGSRVVQKPASPDGDFTEAWL